MRKPARAPGSAGGGITREAYHRTDGGQRGRRAIDSSPEMKVKCPQCGAEVEWKESPYRPFCSERCKLIDLGAWIEGRYVIPGEPTGEPPDREGEDGPEQ